MGNLFTLDSLREEVDKEFAPVKFALSDGTETTLRNLLRLPSNKRKTVLELIAKISKDDDKAEGDKPLDSEDGFIKIDELVESVSKVLEIVATEPRKLIRDIDGDISLMTAVLNKWLEGSQVGEAENSPDSSTVTASS